jgi:hypothetical protein
VAADQLESIEIARGIESTARGKDVSIAAAGLAAHEEAQRLHQHEVVACPGHGDVKQPPLLVDLLRRPGRQIGRNASIDDDPTLADAIPNRLVQRYRLVLKGESERLAGALGALFVAAPPSV